MGSEPFLLKMSALAVPPSKSCNWNTALGRRRFQPSSDTWRHRPNLVHLNQWLASGSAGGFLSLSVLPGVRPSIVAYHDASAREEIPSLR